MGAQTDSDLKNSEEAKKMAEREEFEPWVKAEKFKISFLGIQISRMMN